MSHRCHAHECKRAIPPKLFVCIQHWGQLPGNLRDAIWEEYTPRQEVTKTPTIRYLAVQQWCVGVLAFKPNDEKAAYVAAQYFRRAENLRQYAIKKGFGDPLKGIAPK